MSPIEPAEKRRPPAFQEYGSDLLTLECIRLMTLAERGLLATMRWHIWLNDTLPSDPVQLARLLGLETAEVRASLTGRVLGFFLPLPDDPGRLFCPELTAQMKRLMERREKQGNGGRYAAKTRKQHRNEAISKRDSNRDGRHDAPERSKTEQSRIALGKEADIENRDSGKSAPSQHQEWISAYSVEEAAARYRCASRGN